MRRLLHASCPGLDGSSIPLSQGAACRGPGGRAEAQSLGRGTARSGGGIVCRSVECSCATMAFGRNPEWAAAGWRCDKRIEAARRVSSRLFLAKCTYTELLFLRQHLAATRPFRRLKACNGECELSHHPVQR